MTEETTEIHRSLGRLEGKMDLLLVRLDEHSKEAEKITERVTKIESDVSGVKSISGIVAALAAGVVTVFAAVVEPLYNWFKGS